MRVGHGTERGITCEEGGKRKKEEARSFLFPDRRKKRGKHIA